MKVKIKGGFKGMLMEHGEKAVFAVGVLCFLLFAYSLFGRPTLPPDKEPARLAEAVAQAKDFMEHQAWDEKREGMNVVDYMSRAKRDDVVASNFALRIPFDQPLRDMKRKRTDPALLAVVDLRTAAGVGAFALKSERAEPAAPVAAPVGEQKKKKKNLVPAGGGLEDAPKPESEDRPIETEMAHAGGFKGGSDSIAKRENWVVVTALVPIKKQFAEYDQTFKDTIPVTDGAPLPKDAEKSRDTPEYRRPYIERSEVVPGQEDAVNWQPVNLKGLGKFIKQWAGTMPEIVGQDYLDPVYTMPLGPLAAVDWDDSVGHEPEIPLAAKEELEKNAAEAKKAKVAAEGVAEDQGVFGGGGTEGPPKTVPKPAPTSKRVERKIVEYKLFRFFDFDVEPGKSYRYRVRLAVKNPNFNLADKYLKNVDSKKDELRDTPWSAPSPAATVPFGNSMAVATVQPARGIKEATIKVKLTTIDEELGLPATTEEEVTRGTLLNFERTVDVANLVIGKWVKRENVNFETNALLVDIRGGQPLSSRDKNLTTPGEALIFNADMKLVAHNELDDLDMNDVAAEAPKEPQKGSKAGGKKDPNDALNGAATPRKKKRRRG